MISLGDRQAEKTPSDEREEKDQNEDPKRDRQQERRHESHPIAEQHNIKHGEGGDPDRVEKKADRKRER